jgi:hypothetical protein
MLKISSTAPALPGLKWHEPNLDNPEIQCMNIEEQKALLG